MRESILSPSNFILPLFVHDESDKNQPISSMPGCFRLAFGKNIVDFVAESRSYGINQVVIFPKVCWALGLHHACRSVSPQLSHTQGGIIPHIINQPAHTPHHRPQTT